MTKLGIDDPWSTIKISKRLSDEIAQAGLTVHVDDTIENLSAERLKAREEQVSPFFDPLVCGLSKERFFWMKLSSRDLECAALQAYRYDYVDTSLSDWAPSYHIGLYMRRNEMCVPTHSSPPPSSIGQRLRGRMVYHGEFWINPQLRNRTILEKFSRLGMILALLKWQPDAVWALSTKTMATHGHPSRMGYSYMEGGFLRWQWALDEKHHEEWLNVAERSSIEQMVQDMSSATPQEDLRVKNLLNGVLAPAIEQIAKKALSPKISIFNESGSD